MRNFIKKCINKIGFDLYKFSSSNNTGFQLYSSLNYYEVDVIFDIGANTGQFASELFSLGYKGVIVSFEPLSEAHKKLLKNSARNDKWIVFDRCAVGATSGFTKMNISNNGVSSSILSMLPSHLNSADNSFYSGKEKVELIRLDDVYQRYLKTGDKFVIKVDTQGYESNVIDGANHALSNAVGVICEMSLVPLYCGQQLWIDIINKLETFDLHLFSILRGFTDNKTGQTLQIDGVFFK